MNVFTVRSSGIGIATGVLAVVVFGQLMGVGWGLAVLNGLALGVAVLLIAGAGRLDGDGSTEPMRPSASERSDSARGGTGAARE